MKRFLRAGALLLLAAIMTMTLASCAVKPVDDRVVVSAEGVKFSYDEFRYFFMNSKEELDGGDASVWKDNEELSAKLTEDVALRIKRAVAICAMAEEYGIKIGSDDKKIIEQSLSQIKASCGSEEAYLQMLEDEYCSEYAFEQTLRNRYLYERVREYAIDESNFIIRADDETLLADIEKNFMRGAQILIRNDDGEDPEKNRKRIEEIYSELEGGESFFRLVAKYGEDPRMMGNDNGYYFTSGQLMSYFEDTVKELEIGAYSEVTECVYGYAIIMRLPMEQDYIRGHLEELREAMKIRIFDEMLDERAKKIELQTTTLYHQLTIENMR